MDNGAPNFVPQQGNNPNEYSAGDYSSSQGNQSYPQHQISTTVTTNRPSSINSYGGQSINPNGNNTYKLKQQRNYGNNRYDPLSGQSANYQTRNPAQVQGQWNNGVPAAQSPYGTIHNAFTIPQHYQQQQAELYAGYYGTPQQQQQQQQQASYGSAATQQTGYGEYGQQTVPPESAKGGHVLYVYGIGQRATQEEIFALFQPFGRVLRVDIIIDFNTGLCKGYAFVSMEQYQEAQLAIENLNTVPFHGRQLQVRFKT